MAHQMVGACIGIPPNEVEIQRDSCGKPFIPGNKWFVSISHSGDYVVCAVDRTPVGVDVERIRPIRESLVHRACTKRETDYIYSEAEGADRRFMECWTAKEALFKCCGGNPLEHSLFYIPEDIALYRVNQNGYTFTVAHGLKFGRY